MIKRLFSRVRSKKHKGQGFVELMLIIPALALMLAGVVEFGMLLNNYLKVLDGTREGARLGSQMVAFDPVTQNPDERFFVITASKTLSTMTPIDLNGNRGDDIVISVFSMVGKTVSFREPNISGYTGWSLCANYGPILGDVTLKADFHSYLTTDQFNAFVNGWNACTIQNSRVSDAEIQARMVTNAINSGIVLVEAYYNYPQILKLPVIEQIGDPIPVYAYSLMPIASAMPTPTLP
jgi:hypothetical protein